MDNHGAVFCSPVGIEDAVELLNMTECMAVSILTAKMLGNPKTIPAAYVKEMDRVSGTRGLKFPGEPGRYQSVSEMYDLKD